MTPAKTTDVDYMHILISEFVPSFAMKLNSEHLVPICIGDSVICFL